MKMQLLKDVVGNDTYRINNKYDTTYPPLPVEEVIQRSEFAIGQEVTYDLLVNNCEHFVTLLRYGEGVSEQVSFLQDVREVSHIVKILSVMVKVLHFNQSAKNKKNWKCQKAEKGAVKNTVKLEIKQTNTWTS